MNSQTMTVFPLSEEQQVAHDSIVDYITGRDHSHLMKVLVGYAGTGKTFTLGRIIDTLQSEKSVFGGMMSTYKIAMSAPTHKAVRVLRKFAQFDNVEFATIHSLLGLREKVDERTGKLSYEQSKDPEDRPRIEEYNVLFIDECSMFSAELFQLLLPYVKNKGLKLIFVGDAAQIPPVGKTESIPLDEAKRKEYNIGLVQLTKVMRQATDNPILEYATKIRQVYKTADYIPVTPLVINDKGIECLKSTDEEGIRGIIRQYFASEQFASDSDYMKIIAWTNRVVDAFNVIAREEIYGEKTLPLIKNNEKLIMDKPLLLMSGRVLLSTNQEISVKSFDIQTAENEYMTAEEVDDVVVPKLESDKFKYYNTFVSFFDNNGREKEANIRIAHEDEVKRIEEIAAHLTKMATKVPFGNPLRGKLWKEFYEVQRMFAQVKYNYAVTSHKSQGSTYDNCMMIDWDINTNKRVEERNRVKYVAATRARNRLFIVNY